MRTTSVRILLAAALASGAAGATSADLPSGDLRSDGALVRYAVYLHFIHRRSDGTVEGAETSRIIERIATERKNVAP
jgi:hypothetical protein